MKTFAQWQTNKQTIDCYKSLAHYYADSVMQTCTNKLSSIGFVKRETDSIFGAQILNCKLLSLKTISCKNGETPLRRVNPSLAQPMYTIHSKQRGIQQGSSTTQVPMVSTNLEKDTAT